jgi:quinoprotein glucose dehydrogenase
MRPAEMSRRGTKVELGGTLVVFGFRAVIEDIAIGLLLTGLLQPALHAQADWRVYGGDWGNTHFSTLRQITPTNVSNLRQLWTWDSGETALSFETTPLVIDHVMYISTPNERVVALDADTGGQIWSFDPKVEIPSTHRGVTYWPGDGKDAPRLIVATTEGQIYAIDVKTGKPITSFGDNGVVNYRATFSAKYPDVLYGFSSPPALYKDLIIFGPRTAESGPKGPDASVRALDVRTGKQVWAFHTLPRPGEPGYDTWGPEYYKEGGGPSAWAELTVDSAHGMVFVPVGNPTGGGDPAGRKGNNLYSDCILALNANTGKLIWYYQVTHHDVWDYDVPAPPTLIDVVQNGRKIPALAQITKQGLLFILNRLNGKPIFGAEERTVPAGENPADVLSPTQPFPLKPLPLARNSMLAAEVSHISPESAKSCGDQVASREVGGPFLPRSSKGAIIFPSSIGGGNWGGVSYDASLGLIFVNTMDLGSRGNPVRPPSATAGLGRRVFGGGEGGARFVDQDRYPCNEPPWGRLTAVNVNTGDIAWQVTLGSYKPLEKMGITDAGAANLGPSLVIDGGLLFIGATNDQRFRAFDARSGKQLWQVDLGGDALAGPMTYLSRKGGQILVAATGGPGYLGGVGPMEPPTTGKITAFAIPEAGIANSNHRSQSRPSVH